MVGREEGKERTESKEEWERKGEKGGKEGREIIGRGERLGEKYRRKDRRVSGLKEGGRERKEGRVDITISPSCDLHADEKEEMED